MDINTRFSIVTYVGDKPLNIMAKSDPLVAENPIRSEQWDKFIQATDTIYASQLDSSSSQIIQNPGGGSTGSATERPNRAGSIPVFWTIRTPFRDALGNITTRYIPSPDSTLRSLSSKESYYIILRDTSSVPIRIPTNGNVAFGYADVSAPPEVNPKIPDKILNNDFRYDFKTSIINLTPGATYNYTWDVISSNWPVATNNISGTLVPSTPTGIISTTFSFCPTSGSCSDKMLTYTLPTSCSLEVLDKPQITARLELSQPGQGRIYSDSFTVTCDDCLPKPRIFIDHNKTDLTIVEPIDDDAPIPSYELNIRFANLERDYSYSYRIDTLYSEWPIIFLTSPTGSFFLRQGAPEPEITRTIFFCPTSGLCVPNEDTVPNYNIPNFPKFLSDYVSYKIVLQAILNINNDCSEEEQVITSEPITLIYKRS